MPHSFRKLFFACTIALFANGSPALSSENPSFDCSKASAPDEIAICASAELSMLDRTVSKGYEFLRQQLGNHKAETINQPFFRARTECKSDQFCIRDVQLSELPSFAALGFQLYSSLHDKPTITPNYDRLKHMIRVGECALTTVKQTSYRLCNPDNNGVCIPASDSGSSVLLENGIYGVSYDLETALKHTSAGDAVVACLAKIPKDCPANDDRGYIWRTENLRTKEYWELPDSEHGCGGA